MHSLSLLLSAVAGVNAMVGHNIKAVVLPGNQWICTEDCVHQGVFLKTEVACPENETVSARLDQPWINSEASTEFFCPGEPDLSLPGMRQIERKAGEGPKQCDIYRFTDPKDIRCLVNRDPNEATAGKTVQWADVAELLEEAAGAGAAGQGSQTQPQPPTDQKLRQQCAREGQAAFANCHKGFAECDRIGQATIESCLAGQ